MTKKIRVQPTAARENSVRGSSAQRVGRFAAVEWDAYRGLNDVAVAQRLGVSRQLISYYRRKLQRTSDRPSERFTPKYDRATLDQAIFSVVTRFCTRRFIDIYNEVRQDYETITRRTVFRRLHHLIQLGRIVRVQAEEETWKGYRRLK